MKICQEHWDKFRKAISERGLYHLVAKTGEEAAANETVRAQGGEAPYDPLMDCHWMVSNRALGQGGLYLLGMKEDGSEYCPVCEGIVHKPHDMTDEEAEREWIDGPADAALGFCRDKGLVPGVQ